MYAFRYTLDFGASDDMTQPWEVEVSAGRDSIGMDQVVATAHVNVMRHLTCYSPEDAADMADAIDSGAFEIVRALYKERDDVLEWSTLIYLDRLEITGPVDLDVLLPLLVRHLDHVLGGYGVLIACYPNDELTDERLVAAGLKDKAGDGWCWETNAIWPESVADRWAPVQV
jgi:hypothetical protein